MKIGFIAGIIVGIMSVSYFEGLRTTINQYTSKVERMMK